MDVIMVFPWALHRVQGSYIEHTVSISPGYGEGKTTGWRHTVEDTTCSYEQLSLNARSQQLAFPAKPFPSTRKYQEVTDQFESDESCTLQWAKHFRPTPQIQPRNRRENCWSQWQDRHEVSKPWIKPETEQEINTVPTEISPDLGKSTIFITVTVLQCYSDQIPWRARKHRNVCSPATPLLLL